MLARALLALGCAAEALPLAISAVAEADATQCRRLLWRLLAVQAQTEESLGEVLRWASGRSVVAEEDELVYDANPGVESAVPAGDVGPSTDIDDQLLAGVLDRALVGEQAAAHVAAAADVLYPLLRKHERRCALKQPRQQRPTAILDCRP